MTNAQRAAAHKARLAEQGLVQFNAWVPAAAVAELKRACELLREHPELEVARLVNRNTGKLCGIKRGPTKA